jgi:hypothetical protein
VDPLDSRMPQVNTRVLDRDNTNNYIQPPTFEHDTPHHHCITTSSDFTFCILYQSFWNYFIIRNPVLKKITTYTKI